jgi:hypothetical protein
MTELSNNTDGIKLHNGAHSNVIEQNIIGGNMQCGIHLLDSATNANILWKNNIGINTVGVPIPNGTFGIALFNGPKENMIGPDNFIAHNAQYGVLVDGSDSFTSTVHNTITANRITDNGLKGIFNFRGGNNEITPPVILSVTSTEVAGTTGPGHIVEVFADEEDEGRYFLASTVADGNGNFTLVLSEPCTHPNVTATCTDTEGNTSEFSQARVVAVELINLEAIVNEANVTLTWSTASELNNFGFDVERSRNGKDFIKIGTVSGNGTTTNIHRYIFTDYNLPMGQYFYRLKQKDTDGTTSLSFIVEAVIEPPKVFELSQNYPNPFNPTTKIKYRIPLSPTLLKRENGGTLEGFVTLKVYDILGKEIATLVNEEKSAGVYEVEFIVGQDSSPEIASGVYFYQLKAGEFIKTKKFILLR